MCGCGKKPKGSCDCKYADGGMIELPYGPEKRSQFDTDQFYADKGMEALLRQDMRKENRMANREGRQTGSFPARPSDVQFLLDALGDDRMNRGDMVRKGFRNEAGRALAKYAGGVALAAGAGAYKNTPSQITRPQGAFGQPNDIDLNALQRIGMMLGLGPY